MNVSNNHKLGGISEKTRDKLALLIRNTKYSFTVSEAAKILGLDNIHASKTLSRFVNNGWLSRIKRDSYIVLPIESYDTKAIVEDSWVVAQELFAPCYIAGWSALGYWHLTEQIFNTTIVITTKKTRDLHPEIGGAKFWIKVRYLNKEVGIKSVWRNNIKVQVSNPSQTIIDVLDDPKLAGGIRPVLDALRIYFLEQKDLKLICKYAANAKNKAIYKRLGFLLEYANIDEPELINLCLKSISAGNSKLDPSLPSTTLVKKWRLWVPSDWKENWARYKL